MAYPDRRGFSLLEIMIALAIVAIVLSAVHRLYSQSIAMATYSRFQVVAPLLAQGKRAQLLRQAWDDLAEGEGDFGAAYPGYHWALRISTVNSTYFQEASRLFKQMDLLVGFADISPPYRLRWHQFAGHLTDATP